MFKRFHILQLFLIYYSIKKILLLVYSWNSLLPEPAGFSLREDSGHGPAVQPVEIGM
jgi:hypothetical protein